MKRSGVRPCWKVGYLRKACSQFLDTHSNELTGVSQHDDDFTWEDEEEEATSPTGTLQSHRKVGAQESTSALPPAPEPTPISRVATPGTMSPSLSENSYDIVSSGHTSNGGEGKTAQKAEGKDEESGDSDWE